MTTSLKDVSSAQMIHTLTEMNCFETECTVYGYVWRDRNGRLKYTTSEDNLIIHQSFEEKAILGYAMSPIRQLSTRLIIKEETKDDILLLQKLRLSKELQQCYTEAYFEILNRLCALENDDQAASMLNNWCQDIEGYYDADMVQLFEGAVNKAYKVKHLTPDTYRKFSRWIQQSKKQISKQGHRMDNFSRVFYGIAYEKSGGNYGYLCNANQQAIFERMNEFDEKGVAYTPVFSKEYVYHRSNDLKDVRKAFENHLREIMDEDYLQCLRTIKELPFHGDVSVVASCVKEAQEKCAEEAAAGIQFWLHRWNMA